MTYHANAGNSFYPCYYDPTTGTTFGHYDYPISENMYMGNLQSSLPYARQRYTTAEVKSDLPLRHQAQPQQLYTTNYPQVLTHSVTSDPLVVGNKAPPIGPPLTIKSSRASTSTLDSNDEIPFNVDEIWKKEFSSIFGSQLMPDLWGLEKYGNGNCTVERPRDTDPVKWFGFEETAKVRYCCAHCGNGWTSMKGKVLFHFFLFPSWNDLLIHGQVPNQAAPSCQLAVKSGKSQQLVPRKFGLIKFQVFGQQCGSKTCKEMLAFHNKKAKSRRHYPGNSFQQNTPQFEYPIWYPEEITKVLQNLFHEISNKIYGGPAPVRHISSRTGKPRGSHSPSLCQACRDGSCFTQKPRTTQDSSGYMSKRTSDGNSNRSSVRPRDSPTRIFP